MLDCTEQVLMVLQNSKGIPKIYITKGNKCLKKIKNGQKYFSPII